MTIDALRELVFNEIGLNMEQDVLTDPKLIQCWNQATKFWARYMNPTKGSDTIGFSVPEGETSYEFTDKIPQSINVLYQLPSGSQVPCWLFWYAKPTLHLKGGLGAGDYAVCYNCSLSYEDLSPEEVPEYLLWLVCAYAKRKVGQFMKFSSYQDDPFGADGESWYQEGDRWAKELEEFIRVNRDERLGNLTNFTVNTRRLLSGLATGT